jgi:hypothetical protein
VAYAEANADLLTQAVKVANSVHKSGLRVAPSVIGASWAICHRINPYQAEDFYVRQLIGITGLEPDSVAKVLRQRFEAEDEKGSRMDPDEAIQYTALAWNHFRKGSKPSKLQRPAGGWRAGSIKFE